MPVILELDVVGSAAGDRQGSARLRLRNDTGAPIAIHAMQLESPSLALEIEDGSGEPVLLPPPPVPDPTAQPVIVAPGETREAEYPEVVPAWSGRGRFRVRARLWPIGGSEPVHSPWRELEL